jgi:hypothetical protein
MRTHLPFIDVTLIRVLVTSHGIVPVSRGPKEAKVPSKAFWGAALIGLTGTMGISMSWYFNIYRASEVRLPVANGQVDLSPLGNDWDTLCVIGAYENNRAARAITGLDIDIDNRSRSVKYDSVTLLVTIDDRRRYRLYDVRRHPSDFVKLSSTCWPYGTAFVIEAGPRHYVGLPGGG